MGKYLYAGFVYGKGISTVADERTSE